MWIGNCSKRRWMGEPTHIKMEVAMAPTDISMVWNIFSFTWPPYNFTTKSLSLFYFMPYNGAGQPRPSAGVAG